MVAKISAYYLEKITLSHAYYNYSIIIPEHEHVMQPWASITTQAGSHLLKSKEGHPPAPGTDVTDAVVYPDAAVEDAVNEWKQ